MNLERPFLAFVSDDKNVYINALQARQIVFDTSGVDIVFSETHTIHLDGVGAIAFADRLQGMATALNGVPLNPVGDILPSASSEDRPREA